ncbi:MAG: mechanosensitive ion channel family protein [Flavobacteriales bacterium]|jgi:MscS family membrane protein|nr:mechanosensitive ion channel family protein [Flavobacteriales bacterium]MDG1439454.1 mechanosensitive ion channel family protein [Flavobacteriales bacterium]MDG1798116.1 mechanosensitive ion channel family protein [Flavobacteriales bacterium]
MTYLNQEIFGNPIEKWLIALGILLGSFVLVKVIYWMFSNIFQKITSKTKNKLDDKLLRTLQKPITFLIIALAYLYAVKFLHFTSNTESILLNIAYLFIAVVLTSIISRIIDAVISEVVLPFSEKSETSFDNHLIPVIQKAVRAIVWSLGIVIGLDNIGFDITAMIAGLGIGGLALALAAQDSVKNIFAGIMIFLDKPFKIKDRIKIDGHDGVVEEVGLRSTRIRTLEGRIVTIPNCTFTDNSVINVTSQPALKVRINLGLTYDTTEEDMQKAIDILKDIVKNQDAITDDYAAGFNGFGDFSLNILFMYYVRPESHWLNTQTLVNKEVLKRFNEQGLEFAFPTQTIFKKEI